MLVAWILPTTGNTSPFGHQHGCTMTSNIYKIILHKMEQFIYYESIFHNKSCNANVCCQSIYFFYIFMVNCKKKFDLLVP